MRILKFGVIDYVVIDEAHHATNDNSYGVIFRILSHANRNVKLVGFTATPRHEKSNLFTGGIFHWGIDEGIDGGFLVPLITQKLNYPTHCTNYVQRCMYSVSVYMKKIYTFRRLCLAFFACVEESKCFLRALTMLGVKGVHIDGTTCKTLREKHLNAYIRGYVHIVCNVGVLTEGFDAPKTSAILLVRSCNSDTLLTQIVGRGMRLSPQKRNCLFIQIS